MEAVINFYQCIEQLVRRPHGRLVFGKSRIERCDAGIFVIVEYFFARIVPVRAGEQHTCNGQQEDDKPPEKNRSSFLKG